jgi:hypothetical protein
VVPWDRVAHLDPADRMRLYRKLERIDNHETNEGYAVESSEFERFLSIVDSVFADGVFHVDPTNLKSNLDWKQIEHFLVQFSDIHVILAVHKSLTHVCFM